MNGTTDEDDDVPIDRKPIITCAGELEVFSGLEDALSQALPQDSAEWRRSLGRPVRSVHIGANFAPFSPTALPKESQWDLIRQPLFHIYWTECTDVDTYKATVRDDIEAWMKEITSREIPDWLIVVVETLDTKRANKLLPRTTVLDKIRADFAPKQGDRCISVISPGRAEARSADSWRGLVARVRHLVLVAYARAVAKLEDHVRQQREKRNEPGWHFTHYFHLQEELAQVLEMLGLYDEALVQYDELDALFSQFVVNGHLGDAASWLNEFQRPLERWHGLHLGCTRLPKKPSILELRAYLFSKQAHMLLLINKPWEMASRCLPFLHTCVKEIALLEVQAPPGAMMSWLFLASMEVLQTCDKFNDAGQVEAYSLHTASLWAYASQKLRQLGELCGLLPGGSPSSEQLHLVVGLSAGMGDRSGTKDSPSPTDKLKEALCSQDAFNKHYLELAELAVGTYKHIGRLRSARLVGREVASFYMLLGQTQKAAAFLGDALRAFEADGWHELSAQTQLELAECYRNQPGDLRKYLKACTAVAAASDIDTLIRWTYFEEMLKKLEKLEKPLNVPFGNVFKVLSISIRQKEKENSGGSAEKSNKNRREKIGSHAVIVQDNDLEVELELESSFPREILCTHVAVSLEPVENASDNAAQKQKSSSSSAGKSDKKQPEQQYVSSRSITAKEMKMENPALQKLRMQKHLDYKQDKQLSSASVVCRNPPLQRKDSASISNQHQKSDFNHCLEVAKLPLMVTPGLNVIKLTWKAKDLGKFSLAQVTVHVNKLEFVSALLTPRLMIEVKREEPTLRLDKGEAPLIAGLEQTLILSITIGSYAIPSDSVIKLICSRGLLIHNESNKPLASELNIPVTNCEPFQCTCITLRVSAEITSKDHQVTMHCPWKQKAIPVKLGFSSPMTVSWRLHTSRYRKFVQVTVAGTTEQPLHLTEHALITTDSVKLKDLNPDSSSSQLISNGSNVSYMWELLVKLGDESPPIKTEFSIRYTLPQSEETSANQQILPVQENNSEKKIYRHVFDIVDYQTLYMLEAKVEPTKGNEFCRVGVLCNLRLCVKRASQTLTDDDRNGFGLTCGFSLMYEVCAEQSVWAICGRTAGVVSFDGGDSEPQTVLLDIMPLVSGYLPLPLVRLSKYIPADQNILDKSKKTDMNTNPRLEPFSPGQVFSSSKAQQVHVIVAANDPHLP